MGGLVCPLSTGLSTDHLKTGVFAPLSTSYQQLVSSKTPAAAGKGSPMHFQEIISTLNQIM
jgi:glycyl-tRNA synthetase alpha chain